MSASLNITTIGLAYQWLDKSIQSVNQYAYSDSNLWGDCHKAVIFGGRCQMGNFAFRNSIVNRIGHLLRYLHITADPVRIPWERIIIVGHSQGATHATYMAKEIKLRGMMSFSGQGEENAGWIDSNFTTPLNQLRLINHELEFCIDNIYLNIFNMGLEDALCTTDGQPTLRWEAFSKNCLSYFLDSHVVPLNISGLHPYHESTLVDFQTPEWQLTSFWEYLLLGIV